MAPSYSHSRPSAVPRPSPPTITRKPSSQEQASQDIMVRERPAWDHWESRLVDLTAGILSISKLVLLYLVSELIIWGWSRVMALWGFDFMASVVAMVFIAIATMLAVEISPWIGTCYRKHLKSDVSAPFTFEI